MYHKIIFVLIFFAVSFGVQAQILDEKWKVTNGVLIFPDRDTQGITYSVPIYKNGKLHYVNGVEIIYSLKNAGKKEFLAVQKFYEGKIIFGQKIGPFVKASENVFIGGGVRNKVYDAVISKNCGNPADTMATGNVMISVFRSQYDSVFVNISNHCSEGGI